MVRNRSRGHDAAATDELDTTRDHAAFVIAPTHDLRVLRGHGRRCIDDEVDDHLLVARLDGAIEHDAVADLVRNREVLELVLCVGTIAAPAAMTNRACGAGERDAIP